MKKFWISLVFCIAAALTATPFAWRTEKSGDAEIIEVTVGENFYLDADSVVFHHATVVERPTPAQTDEKNIFPAGTWRWRVKAESNFSVNYQGCRIAGRGKPAVCLLPETHFFAAPPKSLPAGNLPEIIAHANILKSFSGAMDQKDFLAWLAAEPAAEVAALPSVGWLWLLAVLAGGFLLNLTPCVLPMIPVNLAIIGASGGGKGALRGLAYGAGMAVAYGVLGVVVVLTGARFGDLSGSVVFTFAVAAVFGFFALSMAGVVNLDLSRFATVDARKLRGGKVFVAFLLGALAALLAGACVAPVVGAVILTAAGHYAAGDTWGLLLPFWLGVGMGAPWPLAGAGLAALPRPGKKMLYVKYLFAVILFAASIFYGISGIRLLRENASPQAEIAKLETALQRAKAENRIVIVDFWATWCGNCKKFDREVLQDKEVQAALQKFILVKFQAQKSDDPAIRALLRHFNLPGIPGLVMLSPR